MRISKGDPRWDQLKAAWDGRAGTLVMGSVHYNVVRAGDEPVFIPQSMEALYGGSTMPSPASAAKEWEYAGIRRRRPENNSPTVKDDGVGEEVAGEPEESTTETVEDDNGEETV